ncbi:hypothetical protein K0M31_007369 [Melipona bicolor]|uniref:Uncharacterized protein n=1 Tax=Melipona bicolor TaxID=60889 RepID=A0AA40GB97_9HYME|nr:hypothetical protein K0M31_007369 [Melipona bicolor]
METVDAHTSEQLEQRFPGTDVYHMMNEPRPQQRLNPFDTSPSVSAFELNGMHGIIGMGIADQTGPVQSNGYTRPPGPLVTV